MLQLHAVFTPTKQHMFNPVTWKKLKKKKKKRSGEGARQKLHIQPPLQQRGDLQGGPLQRHSTRNAFWEKYLSKEQSARGAWTQDRIAAADGDKGHCSNLYLTLVHIHTIHFWCYVRLKILISYSSFWFQNLECTAKTSSPPVPFQYF